MHISGISFLILKAQLRNGSSLLTFLHMKERKQKDWFKLKRYPHIGFPLNYKDRYKWIEKYVKSPENIKKHAFLPFIHKTSRVKKYRKKYSLKNGKLLSNYRYVGEKKRELFYASHLDSLVYNYYAFLLSNAYEKKISKTILHDCICAYRSIPVNPSKKDGPNKCNIDYANDIFKFISSYEKDNFNVITFDIKSYFDNINHKILREIWAEILDAEKLPPDHFNVYKNITNIILFFAK